MTLALVFMAGCTPAAGGADPRVGSVNGVYVYASDVGGFIAGQAQNAMMWEYFELTGQFEIDFQGEFRDGITFERAVREEMVRIVAFTIIYEDYARQLGVTISDEDLQTVNEHIDFLIEMHGQEEFNEMLEWEGFRDRQHLTEAFSSNILLENLIEAIVEDPEKFAQFEQYMPEEEDFSDVELLGAMHILANFDSFDSEEEAEEFAYEMLERALAGEDFGTLVMTYGQDPGIVNFPNGYTFSAGQMVTEFEETTRELEVGEISGLVRTSFGIHIIMRIEPTIEDWFTLSGMPTHEDKMRMAVFAGFEAMVEEANIVFLSALDDVPLE